jgi:hypothetical protein
VVVGVCVGVTNCVTFIVTSQTLSVGVTDIVGVGVVVIDIVGVIDGVAVID